MTELCQRCGLPTRDYGECADDDGYCYADVDADCEIIACRDRELALLRQTMINCEHDWEQKIVCHFVHHQCIKCKQFRGDVIPEHTVWELYAQIEVLEAEINELKSKIKI